jgi:hypothetical protein
MSDHHTVVSHDQWLQARKSLLATGVRRRGEYAAVLATDKGCASLKESRS